MLDFLGSRLQKSLSKMSKKTRLEEADILAATREIKFALLEADVNLKVVKSFIQKVKEKALSADIIGKLNAYQMVVKIVKDELINVLGSKTVAFKINKRPFKVMMVGLQGSGKTTSVAKLAAFLRKKKQVSTPLIVAGDIYRPAAIEQLKVLGKEIKIDVFQKGDQVSPQIIAKEALDYAYENKNDFIILDTAGRLAIDEKLMDELVDLKKIFRPDEIVFVADALSGQDIINVAKTFHEKLNLSAALITKLDSDARGGAALSIRQILKLPIKYIGTGEKISNLDLFHPERMAERILGMGDVLSLIEKAEEVVDEKKSRKMINRLMAGQFTMDDLLENMKQMKKMGKMKALVKLIPGLASKIDDAKLDSAEEKLQLFEVIISSMTTEERKNPRLLKNSSRKERIIKGSGRTAQEYNRLLNEFQRLSLQMKQVSGSLKSGKNPFSP